MTSLPVDPLEFEAEEIRTGEHSEAKHRGRPESIAEEKAHAEVGGAHRSDA